MASRTDEFAELKRQLDVADSDIALVNKRLDESQGMYLGPSLYACAYNISVILESCVLRYI